MLAKLSSRLFMAFFFCLFFLSAAHAEYDTLSKPLPEILRLRDKILQSFKDNDQKTSEKYIPKYEKLVATLGSSTDILRDAARLARENAAASVTTRDREKHQNYEVFFESLLARFGATREAPLPTTPIAAPANQISTKEKVSSAADFESLPYKPAHPALRGTLFDPAVAVEALKALEAADAGHQEDATDEDDGDTAVSNSDGNRVVAEPGHQTIQWQSLAQYYSHTLSLKTGKNAGQLSLEQSTRALAQLYYDGAASPEIDQAVESIVKEQLETPDKILLYPKSLLVQALGLVREGKVAKSKIKAFISETARFERNLKIQYNVVTYANTRRVQTKSAFPVRYENHTDYEDKFEDVQNDESSKWLRKVVERHFREMKSADVSSLGDEEENSSAQDRQRLMAMTEAAITRMSALNSVGSEFFEFIHASALTFASKMYPRGDASSEVNLHNLVPFVFEDSRSKYLSFIYASTDSSITLFETLKDKTEAVEESNLIFNAVHKSKKSSQLAAYEVAKSGPIWLDNKILSSAKCDELLRGPSPIEVFNSLRAKYDSSSCSYKCATRAPCLPRCKL